ncbi:MAG: hypothetical protein ABIF88_03415 [archaeon]
MKEIKNMLRILRETLKCVENENPKELMSLSNQTIHTATISQDADNIIIAVLVYSIGKVLEREYYKKIEGWDEFNKDVRINIQSAVKALEKNDVEKSRLYLGRLRNSLNKISGDLRIYIKDVFKKAEINKAFKLYEHGISSERTAELLGISLWDMASYIGQSSISDSKISHSMSVNKRIKIAEEIFR